MKDQEAPAPGPTTPLTGGVGEFLATPFAASWFSRARPADTADPDPARRAAAWAQWALEAVGPMTGTADRPYLALRLEGRFYDPKGTGPSIQPHLEIPAWLLNRPSPLFPDRLAQLGNGLRFPWWLVPETLAAKRALFSVPQTAPTELLDLLNTRRASLADAAETTRRQAGELWDQVEADLVTDAAAMARLAADDFTADEVSAYWRPAADLGLRVEFDRKLRDSQGSWVARRVGVWRIVGEADDGEFVLGTLTPRLTRSSLFDDPLFAPRSEAPAANLVSGLLLRRVVAHYATKTGQASKSADTRVADEPAPRPTGVGLRAIVARVGEKLPEASVAAAVKFMQEYPDSDDAWHALTSWAENRGSANEPQQAILTVSREGFRAAHRAAVRALRRAEEPEREDINVILPLAWDANARVVRITWAPRS